MWRSYTPPTPPTGEPDPKRKCISDSPIKESKPKNSVKLRDFSIPLKRIDSSDVRDTTPYTGGKSNHRMIESNVKFCFNWTLKGFPIAVGRIDPSFDWKKEMKLKAENQKPNDLWADLSNQY